MGKTMSERERGGKIRRGVKQKHKAEKGGVV
jgi:hypothetical protein